MPDPSEKLYNVISERGLYSKSYDEFKSQYSSSENIGKLYGALKNEGLVSISQDKFQESYFSGVSGEKSSSYSTQRADLQGSNTIPSQRAESSQNQSRSVRQDSGNNDVGIIDQTKETANSLLRGGFQGLGRGVESLGTAADYLRDNVGDISVGEGDSVFKVLGQGIQDLAADVFPDDPEIQNTFINNTLPAAIGSTASYAAAGLAGGAPLAAIQGGFELGQHAFDEAKAQGEDDDTAMKAFLSNMPLGGLEAIPVTKLLSRLNKGTGGALSKTIKEGAVGGVEEAIQETMQQVGSNTAASVIYDDSRELMDGVVEGGAAGFGAGLVLNALGASVGNRLNDSNLTEEQRAELRKTQEQIEIKKREVEANDPMMQDEVPESAMPFKQDVEAGNPESQSRQQQAEPEAETDTDTETESEGDAPQDLTENTDNQTEGTDEGNLRERGAFTTTKEQNAKDKEFIESFEERGERLYKPVPDDATVDDANRYVEEVGLSAAKQTVMNDKNGLLPRHRVAIGQKVLAEIDAEFQNMRAANDPAADAKLDEQIDFANNQIRIGTELGRGVRAFAYHSAFTPEAHVRTYQREVTNAQKEGKDVEYDTEVARKILKMSREAKKKPEGFQRDEAIMDVMAYIAQQSPTNKTDLAISLGYANMLSGYETQLVNFTSTAANTILETVTLAAAAPGSASQIFTGMSQGFIKGIPEAWNILKTGKITGTRRKTKVDEIPDTLEKIQFKSFKDAPGITGKAKAAAKNIPIGYANAAKYVRRVMAANDVMFFKSGEEAKARVLAHQIAKKENLSDTKDISARVEEILGTSDQQRQAAIEQAEAEGLTGANRQRRINEIAEQSRSDQLIKESAEFGLRTTFNQRPEGVLGWTAQKMNEYSERFPLFKTVVPFTNVVSNVTNTMLDYTPVGLTRLNNWTSNPKYQLRDVPDFGSLMWRQQAVKGVAGTMGMVALAMKNMEGVDEDNADRGFMITGRGPANFRDRYQLQESGWKPYSVKIGDTYYSYRDNPLGLMMSLVGNYHDATKYGGLDEKDLQERVAYVMNSAPQAVLDMSFLTGLSGLFTSLSSEAIVSEESIGKNLIEKGRGFVIPNLVKQVDQVFDPQVYTSDDIGEALIRDIPVARTLKGKPILNVLGEPIRQDYSLKERISDRFLSTEKSDPIWRMIVKKDAFISQPLRGQTKIDDPDRGRRAMDADEHYNYIKLSGQAIKRDLQMNLGRISQMPPEQANEEVRRIVNYRRKQAKDTIQRAMLGKGKQ